MHLFRAADPASASNADAKQRTPIIEYTENLVRDWLRQSDGTAVLMVSTFHPRMEYMNGADRHAVVSAYYVSRRVPEHTDKRRTFPASRPGRSCIPTFCRTPARCLSTLPPTATPTRAGTSTCMTSVSAKNDTGVY